MHFFPHRIVFLATALTATACAGRAPTRTTPTPPETRPLEELRIEAAVTEEGVAFEAYSAEDLFQEGVRRSRSGECLEALPLYDRVVRQFTSSRFAPPSHYNAALCLKEQGQPEQAAARFEQLLREYPTTIDMEHARFQLLELYVDLGSFVDGHQVAERLLAAPDVTPDERVEAMARQSQLLLAAGEAEQAARKAREILSYARLRPSDDRVIETYFLAAANYVLAETIRLRSEAIAIPLGSIGSQRAVLEERAQLLLNAQREYFDTIRHTHPHWAAASGYRIGAMYDDFWNAIMSAPVPPADPPVPESERDFYESEYRNSLASLAKPLIRHSIRYWELTLVMVERTGVETEWTRRIREDLERARTRLLEQPDGPEGLQAGREATPGATEPENETSSAHSQRLRYPSGEGAI